MTRFPALFILPLALAALACTLAAPSGGAAELAPAGSLPATLPPTPAATLAMIPSPTKQAESSPNPSPIPCLVRTGIEGGRLTLRTEPSPESVPLAWLLEGQQVTTNPQTPAAGAWLSIQAGDLAGWVNANYLECNP